ncbi:hypothetical protein E2C01_094592 [Portunus trituberculatus]|uniref:Uncharacterized protein n=1 Tax=Portunus trituberculatus TaxID=210409 RepID=A0A5B7K3K3_PORTR|nr:hypothetical protein [Portunus trituberculatus]
MFSQIPARLEIKPITFPRVAASVAHLAGLREGGKEEQEQEEEEEEEEKGAKKKSETRRKCGIRRRVQVAGVGGSGRAARVWAGGTESGERVSRRVAGWVDPATSQYP